MNTAVPNMSTNGLQNGVVSSTPVTQTITNAVNIPTTPTVKPSGIVLTKNTVFKQLNSTASKPITMNDSNRVEIKSEDIQSSIQIITEDNKKVIISGAKSMNDIPPTLLQQILINVKNIKPNETMLVVNKNENSIQKKEIKSYESIVNEVLGNEPPQSDDVELRNTSCDIVPENVTSLATSTATKNDAVVPKTTSLVNFVSNDVKKTGNSYSKDLQNQTVAVSSKNVHINKEASIKMDHGYVMKDTSINMSTVISNRNSIKSNLGSIQNTEKSTIKLDKVANAEESNLKSCDQNKRPIPEFSMKPILAVAPRQAPHVPQRQKKFLYKLKSKNGKMLSYVSDFPIVLKKPIIRLDKMTQADAERLSRQFAEEKKNKLRKSSRFLNSSVDSNIKEDPDEKVASTSLSSYGVQTRKRQLKFLPSGRIVKGKKSKMYDSSSSLSSLEDDDDKPVVTSDEDYHEDVDIPVLSSDDDKDATDVSFKPTASKKLTPPKKLSQDKSLPLSNRANIQSSSLNEKLENSKPTPIALQPKTPSNVRQIQQKIVVDAPTIFATILRVPIHAHQVNVRKFKPKTQQSSGKSNSSFMFKKLFSPDLKQLIPLLKTSPQQNASFSSPSTVHRKIAPKSSFNSSNIKPAKTTIWSPSSLLQRSLEPPPLAPLSLPGSRNTNQGFFKTPTLVNQAVDITSKFEGFTNTKVVKTKEGPKKAMLNELKKTEEPRTIYDIMEEIFDSMPHWNIHVIPENKSFCLAQISLGRTNIPVLKKSIEINSEFKAKVYVHQLHCKRYDGIYDTESKIRKLIHDVDSVAV